MGNFIHIPTATRVSGHKVSGSDGSWQCGVHYISGTNWITIEEQLIYTEAHTHTHTVSWKHDLHAKTVRLANDCWLTQTELLYHTVF